jgi:hypothetical protein
MALIKALAAPSRVQADGKRSEPRQTRTPAGVHCVYRQPIFDAIHGSASRNAS